MVFCQAQALPTFQPPPTRPFVFLLVVGIWFSGHEGCIKALLLRGADPAAVDVHGPFCLTTGTLTTWEEVGAS